MSSPWDKLSNGYLSVDPKPDKKSVEYKIMSLLCKHPDMDPGQIKVTCKVTGFESMDIKISGKVNRTVVEACVFMAVPANFKINLTLDV